QQGLAAAGGADQQDVALAELDFLLLAGALAVTQPLVVVVDGHRQHLLGVLLADHVLVEDLLDLARARQPVAGPFGAALLHLYPDDVIAEVDTLVADEHRGASNQLADLVLALATEGAVEQLAVVAAAVLGVITHV